jgi:sporulation protein YlmC with PRC-barrel domain
MSAPDSTTTITAQTLVGRKVVDAAGKKVGRVYELEAKRVGNELCVTAVLIGVGSWLTRFGWTDRGHGRRVPWEQVNGLSPHITLRPDGGA